MRDDARSDWSFGDYAVNREERVLRFAGRPVQVAPKVVETLIPFLESPERVISKRELIDRIWPDSYVEEANLTQNIYVLRRMFAEHGGGLRIENVPRRGYRLLRTRPAVASIDASASSPVTDKAVDAPNAVAAATAHTGATAGLVPLRRSGMRGALRKIAAAAAAVAATVATAALLHSHRADATAAFATVTLQKYMTARYDIDSGSIPKLRASADLFRAVAREEPRSALGFAGLAEAEASLTYFTADGAERARVGALALAHARMATRLDASSGEAFAALGGATLSVEHDAAAATEAFATALRLDPDNVHALMWDGTEKLNHGDVAAAREEFARAMALEPEAPGTVASLAWADYLSRDYGAAAELSSQLLRAHELETLAWQTQANADVALGDVRSALPAVEHLERDPATRTQGLALRAQVLALSGRRAPARAVLAALEANGDRGAFGSWDAMAVAAAYARLGLGTTAFLWLDRVPEIDRRQVLSDPRFDTLRADRRFAAWISV
jgi:DNA-binding winged helix-turn-helix (wHTH) protein/tetratricopeptide (TPR) repeat protein